MSNPRKPIRVRTAQPPSNKPGAQALPPRSEVSRSDRDAQAAAPAERAAGAPGCLYVVATPIGHREDLSQRAMATLREVDVIACEDTRHSAVLLNGIGAAGRRMALHDHNEDAASDGLIAQMRAGARVALISDAGTPLVSDPGFRLVRAAAAAGLRVVPIPGPSALIAALSVAGLPTDRFSFEGFLPNRSSARREVLRGLRGDPRTLVFYEARHRIVESLRDMCAELGGGRAVVVARELTKTFETLLRGTLDEVLERVVADPEQQLGEFVVMLAGVAGAEPEQTRLDEGARILKLLLAELPASRAVRLAAEISGAPKNALYKLIDT